MRSATENWNGDVVCTLDRVVVSNVAEVVTSERSTGAIDSNQVIALNINRLKQHNGERYILLMEPDAVTSSWFQMLSGNISSIK